MHSLFLFTIVDNVCIMHIVFVVWIYVPMWCCLISIVPVPDRTCAHDIELNFIWLFLNFTSFLNLGRLASHSLFTNLKLLFTWAISPLRSSHFSTSVLSTKFSFHNPSGWYTFQFTITSPPPVMYFHAWQSHIIFSSFDNIMSTVLQTPHYWNTHHTIRSRSPRVEADWQQDCLTAGTLPDHASQIIWAK